MSYIEGFLVAVPEANKQKYIDHAKSAVPLFRQLGATRLVEGWGDQVPDGKVTDYRSAVKSEDDEQVLFSWVEYPDKATRDAANQRMQDDSDAMKGMAEMPFDGMRMIFAGFEPLVERGSGGKPGYVQGYVAPAPKTNRDAVRRMAETMSQISRDCGALRTFDGWAEDIKDGKVTDFKRAVKAQDGEAIVFGFTEWESKEAFDAAMAEMRDDERMPPPDADMPLDGKRLIFGGFVPVVDSKEG
jgi:uncharacterized protein YbaA (DUF1428 family)